jgi:MoaA/NifB/PqqE/SkfB family radical SAM enzyme
MINSIDPLLKLYIEPTSRCNLDCSFCIRKVWDEPAGNMPLSTYINLLTQLAGLPDKPVLFFGGYGEPFFHRELTNMLETAGMQGFPIEVITNGFLLSNEIIDQLIALKLQTIWISIDGISHPGASLNQLGHPMGNIIAVLERISARIHTSGIHGMHVGVSTVVAKNNLSSLVNLLQQCQKSGVDRFLITNLYPHTARMSKEVLFTRLMDSSGSQPIAGDMEVILPRMDIDPDFQNEIVKTIYGQETVYKEQPVEKNCLTVRWDGSVSICLPLMHNHQSYLGDRKRHIHHYSLGNINTDSIADIWNSNVCQTLRESLKLFDFSPCIQCNTCEMSLSNREDCFGNTHPVCGGCLWAQGFIQCP